MGILYLATLLILIIFILYKTKQLMATLADFQVQFTSIETSLTAVSTEITNLQTQIAGSLSADDTTTALATLTDIANKLAAIVPAPLV